MSFSHYTVPNLTEDSNFTVQAIPERPNGLLLALTNGQNKDLVYAIGMKEGKVITNIMTIHVNRHHCYRLCSMLIMKQQSLVMFAHH